MRLTFCTETGQAYQIEIDPQMELENIMALLEAEVLWLAFTPLMHLPLRLSAAAAPSVWHFGLRPKHLD